MIHYRRRGTAIVETSQGILITAGSRGAFILPGGGAKKHETRFVAALRELTEETGLLPYAGETIFEHLGKVQTSFSGKNKFQDHHTVCIVKATGVPRPGGGDAKRISYYSPGCNVKISPTTREIIERYYEWKQQQITNEDPVNVEDIMNDDIL
jgi:8-oxo-dGTP diphosphatase